MKKKTISYGMAETFSTLDFFEKKNKEEKVVQ